ncbi:MAG: 3-oxoacyl-[acyl-carrier-protein] reductase [Planctomycetes bacterium]|nr:3-oxoacyl-[acyl-carrier-protein] reductase [Planctomycetota bacterium]
MGRLDGKVAVVTGGSRGIGKAIALTLAREGASIVILDVLKDEIPKAVAEIEGLGVKAMGMEADVTNHDQMAAVAKDVARQMEKVNLLVNNAGISRDDIMLRMGEDKWDQVIAVNLKGVFNCSQAFMRYILKAKDGGRIINIASVVGIMGNRGQANYSASKGGVIALTKTTAKELAERGITVNAVAPGYIDTAMTQAISDEAKGAAVGMIPMGRLGQPQDVANAVLFLASDEAAYITGEVLRVDGGMAM